jgi:hypothetical protein
MTEAYPIYPSLIERHVRRSAIVTQISAEKPYELRAYTTSSSSSICGDITHCVHAIEVHITCSLYMCVKRPGTAQPVPQIARRQSGVGRVIFQSVQISRRSSHSSKALAGKFLLHLLSKTANSIQVYTSYSIDGHQNASPPLDD